MTALSSLSDSELVERLPELVRTERHAMGDVIEHLVEMERRRLYLSFKIASLYCYCMKRLGYAAHAALKRHRVAKLALRFPRVLDELRAGTMKLTGLFLLSGHVTEENAVELLGEAHGQSKRGIEELIARRFPRPDVASSIRPVRSTYSGVGDIHPSWIEPLSPTRLRIEFTARAEVRDKVERARELVSHALPSGDLAELFEQALDALIEREERKRFGAGKPRRARKLKDGSRRVPVAIARAVWERDSSQCTFLDAEGCRCTERRFLTIEHRTPFALGGPTTLENLCLLCSAHNLQNARQVFGAQHVENKIEERRRMSPTTRSLDADQQVLATLCGLGFGRTEAWTAIEQVLGHAPGLAHEREALLRECLLLLVPKAS